MAQKIKHITVFSPLYPPHVGGLESHAADWNKEMISRGYKITVWTPQIPRTGAHQEEADGIRIFRYPAFEIIPNYPTPNPFYAEFWQQLRIVWSSPTDLLLSRTRFFIPTAMALLFAKLKRTPLLHIEHGSDFVHLKSPFTRTLARTYDKTIGKLVLRGATKTIANSHASAAFVKELSGRSVDAVIHRGINTEAISSISPHPNSNETIIAYVGRLIDGKGVHDLLDALATIEDLQWTTWIIGDGPQKTMLETQAKEHGIGDKVVFFGELPWEKTIARLKASAVFVNPSYTEGLPTSVIEAGLSGASVIATRVGGTPEIISGMGDGIFFEPGNSKELAAALKLLCENSNLRITHAEAAKKSIANRFSWNAAGDAYEQFFTNSL